MLLPDGRRLYWRVVALIVYYVALAVAFVWIGGGA